jgi:hypothetical protein
MANNKETGKNIGIFAGGSDSMVVEEKSRKLTKCRF